MTLPLIRDKSHDPFIVFGGLFSRDLISKELLLPTSEVAIKRIREYCETIKRYCPNENHLRKCIANLLITSECALPPDSKRDIFYDDLVIEVKNAIHELDLDSIEGSIDAPSGRRKETAEEELFRYLNKTDGQFKWGILTSGRIIRFYKKDHETHFIEFDLFDIEAVNSEPHASLLLKLLNNSDFREKLSKETQKIREVQSKQRLFDRVKAYLKSASGERTILTKSCLLILTIKYLEDIGILPVNSNDYSTYYLRNQNNLSADNLKTIIRLFVSGHWFQGNKQQAFDDDEIKNIETNILDSHNLLAIKTLLFDDTGEALNLSDILIDHLGSIYQTLIHNHAEGAYYTPHSVGKKLTEYLSDLSPSSLHKFARDPNKVIVDPACGSGQLLRAIIPFAYKFYDHTAGYKPKNSTRRDLISRLVGIDKDEESVFICKIGLGLMGVEPGVGLANPRLVKREDTLNSFLDSRRNFIEIKREDIFAVITNPPWESLDFDVTQYYREVTGASLPKKSSLNKATGEKLDEFRSQVKSFINWQKKNKAKIESEQARVDSLKEICKEIEKENKVFFQGKKNLAIFFLYIINQILEESGGAYIVVMPDRFFVGEQCPIRDLLFRELEGYIPFQNCGRIFEGVANGTRFGVIFGRKNAKKEFINVEIPVMEGLVPFEFHRKKIAKADLTTGEKTLQGSISLETRTLPFFKSTHDIDLLTRWIMNKSEISTWEQGKINLGSKAGPGENFGKVGSLGKYKFNVVKSSSYKKADDDKFKGRLNIQFGATVEKIPARLRPHYKSQKVVTSNVKTDGVRKIAVALVSDCLVEHAYNFNYKIGISDFWWLQSLTYNHLVNNLSSSYNINTSLQDFLGGLKTNSKIPIDFIHREVFLLKLLSFSEAEAIKIIACTLLNDYQTSFITSCYRTMERDFSGPFMAIPIRQLLVPYQLNSNEIPGNLESNRHTQELVKKRVAVASFIIDRLKDDASLGRTKLEKCVYLIEALGLADLGGKYERKAAGPLDTEALYNRAFGIEISASNWAIFKTIEKATARGKRIHYEKDVNFQATVKDAEKILGKSKHRAEQVLRILARATTEQAEIIATVFAAWNDLIQGGFRPSTDDIVYEVRNNWSRAKERFTPHRLSIAVKWLNDNNLIPTGLGPSTLR